MLSVPIAGRRLNSGKMNHFAPARIAPDRSATRNWIQGVPTGANMRINASEPLELMEIKNNQKS